MQIGSRRDAKDLVPVAQLICNSDAASNLNVKATGKQLEEGMVKGCVQNCAKQLPSQGFFALSEAKKGIGSSSARSCAINSNERTFKGSTGLVFQEFRAGFELHWGRRVGLGEFSARDRDLLHAVEMTEGIWHDGGDWNKN